MAVAEGMEMWLKFSFDNELDQWSEGAIRMRRINIQATAVRPSLGHSSMFCRNIRLRSRRDVEKMSTDTSSQSPTLGLLVEGLY